MEPRNGTSPRAFAEIGHRELRENLGSVLKRIEATGEPSLVTNRNRIEAVLVTREMFDNLEQDRENLMELKGLVPMLLAAAAAGAAIPSETLSRLGVRIDFNWRALNAFQAAYPIRMTHDENGTPLALARGEDVLPEHVEEADDDID